MKKEVKKLVDDNKKVTILTKYAAYYISKNENDEYLLETMKFTQLVLSKDIKDIDEYVHGNITYFEVDENIQK